MLQGVAGGLRVGCFCDGAWLVLWGCKCPLWCDSSGGARGSGLLWGDWVGLVQALKLEYAWCCKDCDVAGRSAIKKKPRLPTFETAEGYD
jgi:hypothetical protein